MPEYRSSRKFLASLGLAALLALGAPAAMADTTSERIRQLEQQLAASQRMIEQLADRVAQLERAAPAAPTRAPASAAAAAATPADQAKALANLQESVNQISDGLSKGAVDAGVPLHGFADVSVGWSSPGDPQRLRGFNAGSLDIYLTPQLGDRVKALVEVVFESLPSGEQEVDPERLQLGYTVNDALTLWMGRFHTPMGAWNTLFHHGANLQNAITRPRFIDFEDKGGILPTHTVGFWASGKVRLGASRLVYDAYLGNGPSIRGRSLNVNTFSDDNGDKLVGFNLGYQPSGMLGGLTLGAHGLASTVNGYLDSGAQRGATRVRMAGGYLVYDNEGWEVLGEAYRLNNRDNTTSTRHGSTLWFLQVGRNLGAWTPYARAERANLDPLDAYFSAQQSGRPYRRAVAGLRYDLNARAALKLELSETRESSTVLIDGDGNVLPFDGVRYRRTAFEYSIAF